MFNKLVPELVDYFTHRGEVMAVSFLSSYQINFYNKAIFEKEGAEIPKTWDEFFVTLKKLVDDLRIGIIGV